jgi:sec-independent protein translocase protein TatB
MFGFSFGELIIVLVVALIFIKPKDLPEIAHFCGKIYYRAKSYFLQLKNHFTEVKKDLGIEEIKQELERGMAEEKAKIDELKEEVTVIVDLYGNEHVVPNVKEVRPDLDKEGIQSEVKKYNQINRK